MRGIVFRYSIGVFYIFCALSYSMIAQQVVVKGRVIDSHSNEPLTGVFIMIENSEFQDYTNDSGSFYITDKGIPLGEQVLYISFQNYIPQRIRIQIGRDDIIDLTPILMVLDRSAIETQIATIELTEAELDQDEGILFNISGLLEASNDVFLNAAAYDFSAAFFRPRGLGNERGEVLINGIVMNKLIDGRPQWSNWGGLNDAQRNRDFNYGLKANDYSFGGIAGATNIVMRASAFAPGGRLSYASANRSYTGRVMGSYNSGETKKGWSIALLASRRYGKEGYVQGTIYEANSFFLSVEKKLSENQSLNFTGIYTPQRRGRASALTNEVISLKGGRYNPHWGFQNGTIRNSRIRLVEEPVLLLNHYWDLSENTEINTNIAYQFGRRGNTRLDYSGKRNPAGNYYQRLPSYFLRDENPNSYDFYLAYSAEQQLLADGQLNWESFYLANKNSTNGLSTFVLQEDVTEDKTISLNTIFNTSFSPQLSLYGGLNFQKLQSDNFAEMRDLLGGVGYLDIDYFGLNPLQWQSNLQSPDRIVSAGERFRYDYSLEASVINGFVQAQFAFRTFDSFIALSAGQNSYQRLGHYQNGYFPEENRSLGSSEKVEFTCFGIKGGYIHKLSGRHFLEFNATHRTKAPVLKNVFANVRQNNDLVEGLTPETIQAADLGYQFRSPFVKARITGFFARFKDQSEIAYFFTQNALGNDENSAFVQEITLGIDKQHFGIEFGLEAQLFTSLKLKTVASIGQYTYTGNPSLYLSGDDFDDPSTTDILEGNDLFNQGLRTVYLKGYHVASGPEQAIQLGLEYRDTDYWWIGISTNFYSNSFIDISHLRRTSDFFTDTDGLPFNDYDADVARSLLKQEAVDDFFLINLVGGKSWRIAKYFFGVFASVNNLLDHDYKTGGFEDSRRASYRQQLEEQGRKYGPLFGNRYFPGYGTTYFLNAYVRF